MVIIPNQYFGQGDIIFTQTLVRNIADGRHILWPVLPHFIDGLKRAYPDIEWVGYGSVDVDHERKEQYEMNIGKWGKCTILPIRFADQLLNVPYKQCMRAKYDLYGMDWKTWKDKAMWVRDSLIESRLATHMGVHGKSNYTLINRHFGSASQFKAKIPYSGVEMTTINPFSLFDWVSLIEHASDIHTVSTSIIYLLEMLELTAPEVHLYIRKPLEHNFENIDYILERHKYLKHE